MHARFITKTTLAWPDYPVEFGLFALPFILGIGADNRWAGWLSLAAGVAAFILTLPTNHRTGLIRVMPYWMHVAVDRLVAVVFIVATFARGLHGLDTRFYLANPVAGLLVATVVSAPKTETDASGLAHA